MSYYGISFTLMLGVAIGTAIYYYFTQPDINQQYQYPSEPQPEYRPRRRKSTTREINQGDCTICLNKLDGFMIVRNLSCGHNFHEPCIKKWFDTSRTCPVCRRNVNQ